jgi:hypothetical protein
MVASNDGDIADTFHSIIAPKKRKHDSQTIPKQKKRKALVDEMHYIPYTAPDHHTEQGWVCLLQSSTNPLIFSSMISEKSRPLNVKRLNLFINILSYSLILFPRFFWRNVWKLEFCHTGELSHHRFISVYRNFKTQWCSKEQQ